MQSAVDKIVQELSSKLLAARARVARVAGRETMSLLSLEKDIPFVRRTVSSRSVYQTLSRVITFGTAWSKVCNFVLSFSKMDAFLVRFRYS